MQIDGDTAAITSALADKNPAVRLWAIIASQQLATLPAGLDLQAALADAQPMVRIAAVEALMRRGENRTAMKTLASILIETKDWQIRLAALNVIARLKNRDLFTDAITSAQANDKTDYIQRLTTNLLAGQYNK
jgi:HEAT repeat protein